MIIILYLCTVCTRKRKKKHNSIRISLNPVYSRSTVKSGTTFPLRIPTTPCRTPNHLPSAGENDKRILRRVIVRNRRKSEWFSNHNKKKNTKRRVGSSNFCRRLRVVLNPVRNVLNTSSLHTPVKIRRLEFFFDDIYVPYLGSRENHIT